MADFVEVSVLEIGGVDAKQSGYIVLELEEHDVVSAPAARAILPRVEVVVHDGPDFKGECHE